MFTGLVRATGSVSNVYDVPQGRRITLRCPLDPRDLELGASVAVSGVCLTVVHASDEEASFDAAFETLELTSLGRLKPGDAVNLEPSLRMGDPLGGHLVSGHVDGLGSLRSSTPRGDAREIWFDTPEPLRRFIAAKGSITIDGVSLTVNAVDARGFMVGIIPHTLCVTTLGERRRGDAVNLEVDVLARYVARLLDTGSSPRTGITHALLREAGFTEQDPR